MKLNTTVKIVSKVEKQADIRFFLVRELEENKPTKFKVFSTDSEDSGLFQQIMGDQDPFKAVERSQVYLYQPKPEIKQVVYQLIPKEFFKANTKKNRKKEILLTLSANQTRVLFKGQKVEVNLTDADSLSRESGLSVDEIMELLIEGFLLGGYEFGYYQTHKSKDQEKDSSIDIFLKVKESRSKDYTNLLNEKAIVVGSVFDARNLVNEPPNVLTAGEYVRWIKNQLPKKIKIRCNILSKRELKAKAMNGILAVNQGSKEEPYLVDLDYTPKQFNPKKDKTVVLVGKGVTFDSGGLSLKPAKAMEDMKMDMGGSAAAICTLLAVAKLGLKVRVVAITPLTDNMTGGDAFKINDIIKTYSGKTVEVLNTDAEGRLILADALTYAVEKYPTDYVVDLATLTGACLVAVGTYYTGLFSEDSEVIRRLQESSERTGERVWSLPLDDVFRPELKSPVADLKNIGSSYGGASTAAKFLQEFLVPRNEKVKNPNFVDGKPTFEWAHLDIAPTMLSSHTKGIYAKGATGVGVRLLVDFIKQF